jgi:hypothetical protein
MLPAFLRHVTVAKYPERNDLTQFLSFWCIFGADQGRLGTRKRNRSNDLDLICVHLEGRGSIQLSYGRILWEFYHSWRAGSHPSYFTGASSNSLSRVLPLRNHGRSYRCMYRGSVRFFASSF